MTTPGFPLVSVLIPVFNYREYIATAIDSVLAQTYPTIEVVVVDNASTDGTADHVRTHYAQDPRVRLFVNESNIGLVPNFNRAFEHSRGSFVMWLSADDFFLPDHVRRLHTQFVRYPDLDVAYSTVYFCDRAGAIVGIKAQSNMLDVDYYDARDEVYPMLTGLSPLCLPAVLFRRACLDEVGVMDPAWETAADWELCLRVALEGKRFAFVAGASACAREHDRNASGRAWNAAAGPIIEWLRMVEKFIDHPGMRSLHGRERAVVAYIEQLIESHAAGASNAALPSDFLERVRAVCDRLLARAVEPALPRRTRRSVSVIIPFVGRIPALLRALDSLVAQSNDQWEAVIVDGAYMSAAEVVRAHPAWTNVSYLRHYPMTVAGAMRNFGAANARGDLLAFLDEDNRFEPDHLGSLLDAIGTGDTAVAIASAGLSIDELDINRATFARRGFALGVFRERHDPIALRDVANAIPLNAIMQSRASFAAVGRFNGETPILEDFDYLMRLERNERFAWTGLPTLTVQLRLDLVDHVLAIYRGRYLAVLDSLYRARPTSNVALDELRAVHRALVDEALVAAPLPQTAQAVLQLAQVLAGRVALERAGHGRSSAEQLA